MTIEERIQELRKGKGLSQEQLADVLGVSRQAVSKWESGLSLPEVEKLIAMSILFEVTIDYILKGESPPKQDNRRQSARLGSQIVSAVATMLLLMAVIAPVGQLGDGPETMGIFEGLILESVGVMILLVGFFIAGGRVLSKPLFVVNILLAGVLPSSLLSQAVLGYKPQPLPPLLLAPVLLFAIVYLILCGAAIYFGIVRKRSRLI
ncbi:MAG: helix-turn-helix domain-containing protein [Oscillospiraceae bacterium]|nr:helix-turn-helix domain-containing protein [Oscillospiraceae bacterium]